MKSKISTQRSDQSGFPPKLQKKLAGIRQASGHALQFYGSRLSLHVDYPLRHCFRDLKELHGAVKKLLSPETESQRHTLAVSAADTDAESADIALRYQSIAILSPRPGSELLSYLIATEQRQKRMQTQILEELGDSPLKIALSAQTAMLQITIDKLDSLLMEDMSAR
uniref:hypothetical protein n=1 Tax=Microbulbifer agarilyticus TaxID=260552 RepID=UPI0002557B22|nr:hypothetical protein [Microbulbifer agarilyticus]